MEEIPTERIAEARANAYDLLSQLYLRGLTSELLVFVRNFPQFAASLEKMKSIELDDLAADHYAILENNVFPYESIFTDDSGLIGGIAAEQILALFQSAGYKPAGDRSPDHIGVELSYMGWLSHQEVGALSTEDNLEVIRLQTLQLQFLQSHLLRWLIPVCQAIKQQQNPFYTALTNLTLELILDHLIVLSEAVILTPLDFSLPDAPDLMTDENAGIKDIVSFLLMTPYSGFYISRDDIRRLGAKYNLPTGFGSRQIMLQNMMSSAAKFDQFDAILNDLLDILTIWREAFDDLSTHEFMQPIAQVWQERLAGTETLLKDMSRRISELDESPA